MKALVTGTSGILGPVWVSTLEKMGYDIVGFDIEPDMSNPFMSSVDLGDSSQTIVAANKLISNGYIPDVILHNAAIDPKPGSDNGLDPFRRYEEIFAVNLFSITHICREMIPAMIQRGGGIIIFIGSIMGYCAANHDNYEDDWTKAFAYNNSKRALMSLCDSLNELFGKFGIRCAMPVLGPYEEGLNAKFINGFGGKIPVRHPVTKEEAMSGLRFGITNGSVAGAYPVEGGVTRRLP